MIGKYVTVYICLSFYLCLYFVIVFLQTVYNNISDHLWLIWIRNVTTARPLGSAQCCREECGLECACLAGRAAVGWPILTYSIRIVI